MKDAPRYLVERWHAELHALFDESESEDVLDWLIANHDRKRVVLVGAGFSRNARNPRSVPIPLWADISKALAGDLRVRVDTFDALSLADFHRRNQGESAFQQTLLSLLDDSSIEPGEAHAALWNSNPEAVITTNFLDTLLERNPSALPVIEDPDLALPVGDEQAQVIYLHGHRSNFESWVAGRSDYDDLPDKRPMLFARTRQLFAQFPLLVVGYSLTDPDFHLVYRQMVRAMNQRHPMGLAVILPGKEDDSVQAERAAKKYWEDLGLRIVRFRTPADPSSQEQFVRFFSLTRRLEDRKDLERSYRSCETENAVAAAFQANVEVMESAFQDTSLDWVWMRSFDARASFWQAALDKALPKSLHESASESAQKFNREQFRRPSANDGTAATRAEPPGELERSDELDQSRWVGSQSFTTSPKFDDIWRLLTEQRGKDFVWKLEGALRCGTDREMAAKWLRASIRSEILDEHNVDIPIVSCALLILGGWRAEDLRLLHELAVPRDPRLAKALGPVEAPRDTAEPLIALLESARAALEGGDLRQARVRYAEAIARAPTCMHNEGPLLTYFALQGYVEALASNDFSAEALEKQNEARQRAQRAREHSHVKQWWARVDRFKTALVRSKLDTLEQELSRVGYEANSVSWSNSGWRLNVLLKDATRLGAPLSVQTDLTLPLLGTFQDDYTDLAARLRLNLGKPGEWLNRKLLSGDMFRNKSRGLVPDDTQAGATERRSGAKKASEVLFPTAEGSGHILETTTNPTPNELRRGRRPSAIIQVLKSAAEILLVKDLPSAMGLVAKASQIGTDTYIVEALAGIAHVCDWPVVEGLVLDLSGSTSLSDLQRNAGRFPWEHWAICDDFLREGERGMQLIRTLASDAGRIERISVGWALRDVLAFAPSHDGVTDICSDFARRGIQDVGKDQRTRDSNIEQIAGFAAASARFCAKSPNVVEWLNELLHSDNEVARGILLQSSIDSRLAELAKASLRRTETSPARFHERVALATLDDARRQLAWVPVSVELQRSWSELATLAPVLHRDFWTGEGWDEIRNILRVGGHRGKSASWLLARVELVTDALDHEKSRQTLFDDSRDGLSFLRTAVIEGIGSGDGIIANHAVYALAPLARHAERDEDADAIACASRAAADDRAPTNRSVTGKAA